MKKLLPLLPILLLILVPRSAFAVGETCKDSPPTSNCCTAPAIIEQVGGCPSGTKWIGDASTGQCQNVITCAPTASSLSCSTGGCYTYTPPPPPGPGPVCPTATVNTDSSMSCCSAGQIAIRDESAPSKWKCIDESWTRVAGTSDIYHNGGKVGIGTATPAVPLDVVLSSGGGAKIGASTNVASGNYSVAIGTHATASGAASFAGGNNTTASGDYSLAMGQNSTANNTYAVAIGNNVQATGLEAVATGISTVASGSSSFAAGNGTTASGASAFSAGFSSQAVGDYTTAMGQATKADSFLEVAIGRYNVTNAAYSPTIWVATDPLFVIGNGTSALAQANALTVLKNGNVGIGTATPTTKLDVAGNINSSTGFCISGNCVTSWPSGGAPVASEVQWVGITAGTHDGKFTGGYTGANSADAYCASQTGDANARVCTVEDMLFLNRKGSLPTTNTKAWINGGPPGYNAAANDCGGWQLNTGTSTNTWGRYWWFNLHQSWADGCDLAHGFACCK